MGKCDPVIMTLSGTEIIVWLYSISGIVLLFGYLPQITKLLADTTRSIAISLFSWWVWFAGSSISLAYGLLVLHDLPFILICLASVVCEAAVILLTIYNRYVRAEGGRFNYNALRRDMIAALARFGKQQLPE